MMSEDEDASGKARDEAELRSLMMEYEELRRMQKSLSPDVVGHGTATSTDTGPKSPSSAHMGDRARRFALPPQGSVSVPDTPTVSTSVPAKMGTATRTTMTTTSTLASNASGKAIVSRPAMPGGLDALDDMVVKKPSIAMEDHLRAVNKEAMKRAFKSFDALLGSLVNKLADDAGFLESRRNFKKQALQSKRAITPEAAELLVARFWVDMLWTGSPPLIEPKPGTGEAIRKQLTTILVKILKSTKLSGIKLSNCAPIVSLIEWHRDGRIGLSDAERYGSFVNGPARRDVAKGLIEYLMSDLDKPSLFGESAFVQFAFASRVAFWPFLSHLVQKFDGLLCDPDSHEDSLTLADATRYRFWMKTVPVFFENADKTQLRQLVRMMGEEVLKALPDGLAEIGASHSQRKFLLVRCLHVAFTRGSQVLGLQRSQLIQTRNYGLGKLFCVSLVTRLFHAATLIATKEDPSKALVKILKVEPFDLTIANARAAANEIAIEIGVLVNEALDAAKTPQR